MTPSPQTNVSPAEPRRALVGELLAAARYRRVGRWLSWNVLYQMAFDPASYEKRNGPLYREVNIEQRCKCRRLYVPTPLLRWVQQFLLRRVFHRALQGLPEYVACRPGGSVFAAAAPHVGQRFLVNLDLRDFFPSIRLGQVINALLGIKQPLIVEQVAPDPTIAEVFGPGPSEVAWQWNLPAAVFVARLVTRRGRLPKGHPPLLQSPNWRSTPTTFAFAANLEMISPIPATWTT